MRAWRPQVMLLLAGHVIIGKQDVIVTIHGSFLCASLEIGMLRRALMYVCELRQAKPRALGHPHTPADPTLQSAKLQQTMHGNDISSSMSVPDLAQATSARLSGSSAAGSRAGRVSLETAPGAAQSKAGQGVAAKAKRNLTMQVFLHCARIDVSFPLSFHHNMGSQLCCGVYQMQCAKLVSECTLHQHMPGGKQLPIVKCSSRCPPCALPLCSLKSDAKRGCQLCKC